MKLQYQTSSEIRDEIHATFKDKYKGKLDRRPGKNNFLIEVS